MVKILVILISICPLVVIILLLVLLLHFQVDASFLKNVDREGGGEMVKNLRRQNEGVSKCLRMSIGREGGEKTPNFCVRRM